MSGKSYTKYQQGIINRYYETADARSIQRLQELVSEIYLCETDKKADRLWASVEKCLKQIKAKPATMAMILPERDVNALARVVGDATGKK